MKAVAYIRVSGAGQLDGDGFTRQRAAIVGWTLSHDHQLIHEYRESAVPGKTELDGRPAFQEMISDLLMNGCRLVIVESLDRLAREYRVQEQLLVYLASKGISLIAANTGENVTEAMMGDPMRRAMVQIQGVFAELEKNMLVAKLAKARKRKRDSGERCEGPKPYGSRPRESVAIEFAKSLHRSGESLSQIAAALNQHDFKTRSGGKFHPMQVKRILERKQ